MKTRKLAATALLALTLSACGTEPTPEVTPAAPAAEAPAEAESEVEPAPTATEAPAPTTGTREAPLAVGEARKLSDTSAWTVSLVSSNLDAAPSILAADEYATKPAEGETFVLATFSIAVDAEALTAQGVDLANEGAEPWLSLQIEYVAADGTSFDGLSGTMCYSANMLHSQGAVYQDGAVVTGDVCFAVPTDKVSGGLWRVSNMANDSVWIASA